MIAVPDDAIAAVVDEVVAAGVAGRWVAHCAGSTGLAPLAPVVHAGGRRFAIHPLQTFPDVERALAEIPGCTVAVTADDEEGAALGERLARDLEAQPFRLAEDLRPLYHAAAVFASNYLVVLTGIAEELLRIAGVPDPGEALRPLQRATPGERRGPGTRRGAHRTGRPRRRGHDRHATSTPSSRDAPETVAAYVVLCRAALDLAPACRPAARTAGRRVEEVLAPWS